MKKVLKIIVLILVVGIVALLSYLKFVLPNAGEVEDLKIELTEERIDRGKYLANHVVLCVDCHSTRDWDVFSGPIKSGTEGNGGEVFNEDMGFPGNYVAANITPSNLKAWSDGEIFRAVTTGVNKDGNALFPIMPYNNYGQMTREDIYSIIAYIRTLAPIENETQASSSSFPMNFIINTMPSEANFADEIPSENNVIEYGEYLTTASGCYDCHTNQEKGKIIGDDYAGGFEFKFGDGSIVRSLNITPHETGIKNWTEEKFIERFKEYSDSSYVPEKVEEGEVQTVMPWSMYAGMKERDLAAIYAYLQSQEPKENVVELFTPGS